MAKKQKIESTFINMFIVLTAIAFISSLSLAYTYSKTQKAINHVKADKKINAIKQVLPPFDNNPNNEKYTVNGYDGLEFYPAKMKGKLVGTAIKTFSSKGFSGNIWLMVGFTPDQKIYNSSVLEHQETPGLGSKMEEDDFRTQFNHKDLQHFRLQVTKDGGNVEAITAATISSRAFCDAIQKAYNALTKGE